MTFRRLLPDDLATLAELGQEDPSAWIETVFGDELWGMQRKIARAVWDHRATYVRSAHAIGKSFIAARLALCYLYSFEDALVITTAPTGRQVKGILWGELRSAHKNARVPLPGRLDTLSLKLDDKWFALGFKSPDYDPTMAQGWHSKSGHVLLIIDEAAGIKPNFAEVIDALATSAESRVLMIGNPTNPVGPFFDGFKLPGVKKFKVDAFQTPNFTAFGITERDIVDNTWKEKIGGERLPAPWLCTPQYARDQFVKWGIEAPQYRSRVGAEFPESDPSALIPGWQIDDAQERTIFVDDDAPRVWGLDVARTGTDSSVLYEVQGNPAKECVARELWTGRKKLTNETVGEVIRLARDNPPRAIHVDVIGVGAGVVDMLNDSEELRSLGVQVVEVNFAAKAYDEENFENLRAEGYWRLREMCETGLIDLEDSDDLAHELKNIRWEVTTKGRIKIEGKDKMKASGLPSPDHADAIVIAIAEPSSFLSALSAGPIFEPEAEGVIDSPWFDW